MHAGSVAFERCTQPCVDFALRTRGDCKQARLFGWKQEGLCLNTSAPVGNPLGANRLVLSCDSKRFFYAKIQLKQSNASVFKSEFTQLSSDTQIEFKFIHIMIFTLCKTNLVKWT